MKKIILAGLVSATLALTACGGASYAGDYDDDWDLNHASPYNSRTYCGSGTYKPLANNKFACYNNGRMVSSGVRPKPIIPPKRQTSNTQQKSQPKSNSGWGFGKSSGSKSSTSSRRK
jgi:hypothetical protein